MDKKKTMLKNLDMTSVDLVRRGANQEAKICLYKSADEPESDVPHGLLKSIQDTVKKWFDGFKKEDNIKDLKVAKSCYIDVIDKSIDRIIQDESLDSVEKAELAAESIDQFGETLKAEIAKAMEVDESDAQYKDEPLQKLTPEFKEGERKMRIDKSRFTPEELEMYNSLIAKGVVKDDDMDDEFFPDENEILSRKRTTYKTEEETPPQVHPEVKKALEEVETMKKSMEMNELKAVAQKYTVIGKKADELTGQLYEMKKSGSDIYDSYLAALDEQVRLVEKSKMFEEIGKSGYGYIPGGDTVGKIESIASEIQKADPTLGRHEEVMKAWDQHPELLAEYETKYQG